MPYYKVAQTMNCTEYALIRANDEDDAREQYHSGAPVYERDSDPYDGDIDIEEMGEEEAYKLVEEYNIRLDDEGNIIA